MTRAEGCAPECFTDSSKNLTLSIDAWLYKLGHIRMMDSIYIMEYYATIKDHILEKYIMAWENAPSISSKKQITEMNIITIL